LLPGKQLKGDSQVDKEDVFVLVFGEKSVLSAHLAAAGVAASEAGAWVL
jgi:hypothetical protein